MSLPEYHAMRYALMPDPLPVFDASNRGLQTVLRTTVREMPTSGDVLDAIMRALRTASLENHRPVAILLGSRWFVALERHGLDTLSGPWGPVKVFVDSQMERGLRLIYDSDTAVRIWISKQVRIDERRPSPEMADLARQATAGDDGALAVLTDWLEQEGRLEEANAVRQAQVGMRVLARLTASDSPSNTPEER